MHYIIERLKEKSTWAGLATLLAAIGWKIDPDAFAAGSAVIIAIIALWEVLRRDNSQ